MSFQNHNVSILVGSKVLKLQLIIYPTKSLKLNLFFYYYIMLLNLY